MCETRGEVQLLFPHFLYELRCEQHSFITFIIETNEYLDLHSVLGTYINIQTSYTS